MTLIEDLKVEAVTNDEENGWTRTSVKSIPEVRQPDLLKPFKRAYMSATSLTVKDTKTRKVVGAKVTNGELSRLYLRRVMEEGAQRGNAILAKRIPYRKEALEFLDRQPAYFFAGQTGGPFALVDIKACYASLYTRLSIDLTYRPETNPPLLGIGRGIFPASAEWLGAKGPRNALWGGLLSMHGREWRHGQLFTEAYPNQYFAPDLRGVVLDAAHAIALTARETFGALSWAVDGGVFRPESAYAFVHWLGETWGLIGEIRAEGPGWMFGATSYSIGPSVTADVKKGRAMQWPEMDSLRPQREYQRAWLADVFAGRAACRELR